MFQETMSRLSIEIMSLFQSDKFLCFNYNHSSKDISQNSDGGACDQIYPSQVGNLQTRSYNNNNIFLNRCRGRAEMRARVVCCHGFAHFLSADWVPGPCGCANGKWRDHASCCSC